MRLREIPRVDRLRTIRPRCQRIRPGSTAGALRARPRARPRDETLWLLGSRPRSRRRYRLWRCTRADQARTPSSCLRPSRLRLRSASPRRDRGGAPRTRGRRGGLREGRGRPGLGGGRSATGPPGVFGESRTRRARASRSQEISRSATGRRSAWGRCRSPGISRSAWGRRRSAWGRRRSAWGRRRSAWGRRRSAWGRRRSQGISRSAKVIRPLRSDSHLVGTIRNSSGSRRDWRAGTGPD